MTYTSINNEKIKNIKKLNEKKYRDKENLFLVEGEHLVLEAYKNGYLKELILQENCDFKLDIDTIYVSNSVIKYISNLETPQNVLGVCKKNNGSKLDDRILVLDGIQDPGNLGTIIRSAVAFNFNSIVLSNNTVDLYNSKVIRASQGMIFSINTIVCDLIPFINNLKKDNYKIYGTKVTNGNSIKSIEKNNKFAIIVGNEGQGVSKNIIDMCDKYIFIDINKKCESLNVGVATSIILYELDK